MTTADKIRAFVDAAKAVVQADAEPEYNGRYAHLRDRIARLRAALVEADPPQEVQVMPLPLVWREAGWGGWRHGICCATTEFSDITITRVGECEWLYNGTRYSADTSDEAAALAKAAAVSDYEASIEASIIATIELTPTTVDASPAPDPVSQTPALDALAMRKAAAARVQAQFLPCRIGGDLICDPVQCEASADAILALPMPDHAAALDEAMKLPEVRALVDAAERYKESSCEGFCHDLPRADTSYPNMDFDCGGCGLRVALAKLKGASHE